MPKFSVKKPLTVVVAVIAVLVLGVVSFMNMTPDLLPNINLPYVVVVTPAPGQTPEKVEAMVTKPLEQAMATLENIESVSSTSNENSSMVILEFTDDVNMDTVSVDILQLINQVSGYWDESVGTSVIMKLNPSMLPVMVTAVDMEGMDTAALSDFVSDTLTGRLEGIAGVASVNVTGLVEETVEVVLDQNKIDAKNREIKEAIQGEFSEAEEELADAKSEVDSGLSELESAKRAKDEGLDEMSGQLGEASAKIGETSRELAEGKQKLESELAALKEQQKTLEESEKSLKELQKTISELEAAKPELEAAVAQLTQLNDALAQLTEAEAQYNAMIAAIQSGGGLGTGEQGLIAALIQADPSMPQAQKDALIAALGGGTGLAEEQKQVLIGAITGSAEYQQVAAGLAAIDAQLAALGLTRADVPVKLAEAQAGLAQVNDGLKSIDQALAAQGIKERSGIAKALREIEKAKPKIKDGIAQLEDLIQQVENGQMQITQAEAEMERQKTAGLVELSEGTAQLVTGEAELKRAQEQIDQGLEQLEDAREEAEKQADLEGILTIDMLSNLLKAQNFSMPAGYVEEDGQQTLVRVGDTIDTYDSLESLVLLDLGIEGLAPIALSDVAEVRLADNLDSLYARINGHDGVLLSFQKQSTYATASVSTNVAEAFKALEAEYPGLSFVNLMDQGDYIYIIVQAVLENLLLGALFAIIVLFLFLRDIRPTFITLCSIPISVIFALALMYFSGITINIISLSGLAVAVGMLVDNSVVVIENIYRLRARGASAVKAAVSGASQVAGAITASTLTTICVFLPIVFTQGITRKLFTDMALTLGYSLLASLIVALTLVPAMSSGLLRTIKEPSGRLMNAFLRLYEKTLRVSLRHKALVLIACVVLLAGSLVLVLQRGYTFMPGMDMPELTVDVTAPEGADMDEIRRHGDEVAEGIREIEGVDTVGAMLASGGGMMSLGGSGEVSGLTYYVLLDEEIEASGNKVARQINEKYADYDWEVAAASSSSMSDMMNAFGGSGVSVTLYGENQDDLLASAEEVAGALKGLSGISTVDDGVGDTEPELRFSVDKNKAMAKGLTTAQVFGEVQKALTVDASATTITTTDRDYDVIVFSGKQDVLTPDYIRNYSFTHTGLDGEEERVYLRDIADIEETRTSTSIAREQQKRYLTVTAELAEGSNVGMVAGAAETALAGLSLPEGISYAITGENETVLEAFADLLLMLLLGVLLVYLIMVAQFQSLKSPFIVMFTIPLAFTGGLLALLVTGMEMSVISLIGFVMLVGIIVNNGIVLVDYINQLRAEGMETKEATIEAGRVRMRPILMTTVTTILGLSVMALGRGTGSELMQPIAIVCIGGLTYATLLTLYVVPIMYQMFNRKKMRVIDEEDLIVTDE